MKLLKKIWNDEVLLCRWASRLGYIVAVFNLIVWALSRGFHLLSADVALGLILVVFCASCVIWICVYLRAHRLSNRE